MPNIHNLTYLDLFAGAGGLSEGFIRSGFKPIAHVESDIAACYTLKTRLAYWWLRKQGELCTYEKYIRGILNREEFYKLIPSDVLNRVINIEISDDNIEKIFKEIDAKKGRKKISLIIGGPPCQAYSVAGRARNKEKAEKDSRNYLYQYYAKFIERYAPEYFVFENVVGMLTAKNGENDTYFDKMKKLFESIGYSVEYKILNAKDYGVLQNRRRIILIGRKGKNHVNFYPSLPSITLNHHVKEIFTDLPAICAGEGKPTPVETLDYRGEYLFESKIKARNKEFVTFHYSRKNCDRDLEIYRTAVKMWNDEGKRLNYPDLKDCLKTHTNTSVFIDRFKVVSDNQQFSQTIVAHISKDGHYYIHPDIAQNRSITPREAARLQSFPDSYYFESVSGNPSMASAFKQIGNAVPVRMAECIAIAMKMLLKKPTQKNHKD